MHQAILVNLYFLTCYYLVRKMTPLTLRHLLLIPSRLIFKVSPKDLSTTVTSRSFKKRCKKTWHSQFLVRYHKEKPIFLCSAYDKNKWILI